MCTHRLADGPLTCTRDDDTHDENADGGHTYAASWAPDGRHDDITQEY